MYASREVPSSVQLIQLNKREANGNENLNYTKEKKNCLQKKTKGTKKGESKDSIPNFLVLCRVVAIKWISKLYK